MKITKKLLDKLFSTSNKFNAYLLKTNRDYIIEQAGKSGLKRVEARFKQLGYPINFEEIRTNDWFNIGIFGLNLLICKELFGWNSKDFFDMGYYSCNSSLILRISAKYFISLKTAVIFAPKYWRKHNTGGELKIKYNEKSNKVLVSVKDLALHSVWCPYHMGYFKRFIEFLLPNKKVSIVETKCSQKKDEYDEFKITWK